MRRGLRLALLLAALAAGGAIAFAGAQPEGYLTVAQALDAPREGDVHVKGSIVEGSVVRDGATVTFLVADGARTIEVRWDAARPIPDQEAGGTIEGKNVVIVGTLVRDDGEPYLLAHEMTVGCASKYRPA